MMLLEIHCRIALKMLLYHNTLIDWVNQWVFKTKYSLNNLQSLLKIIRYNPKIENHKFNVFFLSFLLLLLNPGSMFGYDLCPQI